MPDDLPFLRSMALQAFSIYGDYETILTDFFVTPGVYTYVAEETYSDNRIPVGIVMMAVRKPKRRKPFVAEIMAIAVEKASQREGIGSRLIEFAKRWPQSGFGTIAIPEVQLSVAESNVEGRSFFEHHGFEVLRSEPWAYPAGQKALRMRYIIA